MTRKLYIKTHGCQMNEYDSSRMADALAASHSLEVTQDPLQADVLLLNTCSIREKAQEKVFSELGRWKELKDRRPELVIGVGGCVASQEGEAIRARAPYVDIVFGPQTLHRLPQLLDDARRLLPGASPGDHAAAQLGEHQQQLGQQAGAPVLQLRNSHQALGGAGMAHHENRLPFLRAGRPDGCERSGKHQQERERAERGVHVEVPEKLLSVVHSSSAGSRTVATG